MPLELTPLRALYLLGGIEKFVINGVRALVVVYAVRHLGMKDEQAFSTYASMMALGYLTPWVGGQLMDRGAGALRMLQLGVVLMILGVLSFMYTSTAALPAATGLLVLGGGLLKTAVPKEVGDAAERTETNSDSAYAILYGFYNAGTLIGTFAIAVTGEVLGWRVGFALAALGGLAALLLLRRLALAPAPGRASGGQWRFWAAASVPVTIALAYASVVLKPLLVVGLVAILATLWSRTEASERGKVIKMAVLMAIHAVFFALYEQGSLCMTLFAERAVARDYHSLFPWATSGQLPVTFFQSIDPFLNVVLAWGIAWLWTRFGQRSWLTVWLKFGVGMGMAGLAFLWLGYARSSSALMSPWVLVLAYALLALGEQFTVPVGFAAVRQLASPSLQGVAWGGWFLSISASEWLAERLSRITNVTESTPVATAVYQTAFHQFSLIAGILAAVLLGSSAVSQVIRALRK